MAADELSLINTPAVTWTTNTDSRGPLRESEDKSEKRQNTRKPRNQTSKKNSPEVEFEHSEHELDSIA
jgi:hypothetical protein